MNAASSSCADRGAAEASRRWLVWLFVGIFCFQAAFGLYYAVSEYRKKGLNQAHNPWARGHEYIIPPGKEYDFGDQVAYNRLAASLLERGGFYNPAGQVSAWVTPGFPLALAVLYAVFGYSFIPVLLFNALCVTLAYALLFRLTEQCFGRETAWIALALLAVNLRVSYHVGYVYSDPLFFLLMAAAVYLTVRRLQSPNAGWGQFVLLGLCCGFGTLVRPVMAPLAVVIVLLLLVLARPRAWAGAALVAGLCVLLVGAWLVRNHAQFGRWTVSTNSEYSMGSVDWEQYRHVSFWDAYRLPLRQTAPPSTAVREQALAAGETEFLYMEKTACLIQQEAVQWLAQHRQVYVKIRLLCLKALFMPYTADMSRRNQMISLFIWSLLFPAAVLGGVILWRNRFVRILWAMTLAVFALPVLYGIDKYLRYQLPGQLLLTPVAAIAYRQAWVWWQARRRATVQSAVH